MKLRISIDVNCLVVKWIPSRLEIEIPSNKTDILIPMNPPMQSKKNTHVNWNPQNWILINVQSGRMGVNLTLTKNCCSKMLQKISTNSEKWQSKGKRQVCLVWKKSTVQVNIYRSKAFQKFAHTSSQVLHI